MILTTEQKRSAEVDQRKEKYDHQRKKNRRKSKNQTSPQEQQGERSTQT